MCMGAGLWGGDTWNRAGGEDQPRKDGSISTQTAPKLSDKWYPTYGRSVLLNTLFCSWERVNVSNRHEPVAQWNFCLIKRVWLGCLEWGKSPRLVRTIKAIRAIKAQLTQLPFEVIDVACCVLQQAELMCLVIADLSCFPPHFRFPPHSPRTLPWALPSSASGCWCSSRRLPTRGAVVGHPFPGTSSPSPLPLKPWMPTWTS